MPSDLQNVYQEILARISQEGGAKSVVMRALSWLLYAKRPLHIGELSQALSVELGDTELNKVYILQPSFILEECKSLIVYENKTGILRLAHHTVEEFIRSRLSQSLLSPVYLTKVLLTYLCFDEFKGGRCYDYIALDDRRRRYRLGRYAAQYWHAHAKDAGRDCDFKNEVFRLFCVPGHLEAIVQLEAEKFQLAWRCSNITPLHFAARYGLVSVCKALLDLNERKSERDRRVLSPGQGENVADDFEVGNVFSRDLSGKTPLEVARQYRHYAIVKLLVAAEANNYRDAITQYKISSWKPWWWLLW